MGAYCRSLLLSPEKIVNKNISKSNFLLNKALSRNYR